VARTKGRWMAPSSGGYSAVSKSGQGTATRRSGSPSSAKANAKTAVDESPRALPSPPTHRGGASKGARTDD
jgi:hypothetical protein